MVPSKRGPTLSLRVPSLPVEPRGSCPPSEALPRGQAGTQGKWPLVGGCLGGVHSGDNGPESSPLPAHPLPLRSCDLSPQMTPMPPSPKPQPHGMGQMATTQPLWAADPAPPAGPPGESPSSRRCSPGTGKGRPGARAEGAERVRGPRLMRVARDPHGWAAGRHRSRGPSISQKAVAVSTQAEGGGGDVPPGTARGCDCWQGSGPCRSPGPIPASPSPGPPHPLWRPRPHPRSRGRRALSSDGTGRPSAENKGGRCSRGKRELLGRGRQRLPTRAASSRPIWPQPRPSLRSRVPTRKSRDSRVHNQTPKEVAGGCPGQG